MSRTDAGLQVVVLSGGLDSTVCLGLATEATGAVALTFDYGQRHRVELERAAAVAAHYGVEHIVARIDPVGWGGSSALVGDDGPAVPDAADAGDGIPVTYVPARNLIFLSMAVAVAEARDADAVWIGVNALDYSGYPDCRPEFVASFAATAALALRRGVEGRPVRIETPLVDLTKADIVRRGVELDAPLHLTWSCYRGGAAPCGRCDACRLRAKGFAEAGTADPALAAR